MLALAPECAGARGEVGPPGGTDRVARNPSSVTKLAEQPAGADDRRAGRRAPVAQLAIGGHDHAPPGQFAHHGHDRVVPRAARVHHAYLPGLNRIRRAGLSRRSWGRRNGSGLGGALEYQDEGRRARIVIRARVVIRQDRAATGGQPDYLGVQPGRRAGPVPPPAVGARAHHVGDIYDDCHQMPADPDLLRTVS